MKLNKSTFVVALLFLVATIWSCRTTFDNQVQPVQNPVSIAEARTWFENKGANARADAQAPEGRLVYWKYAVNDVLPGGVPVVVVPLLYGFEQPIMVPKDGYTQQVGKSAKLKQQKADLQIQKKLLITKNATGNYQSCVMSVIPSDDYRAKNKSVKKDKFDGLAMIYDETETTYLLGLRYKNGRLKEVLKPSQSSGGRRDGSCYKGVYQNNLPAQVIGGGGGGRSRSEELGDQYGMPYSVDFGNSSPWFLVDVQTVDCGDGTPTRSPLFGSDPNEIEWLRPINNGGGGGTTGGGPRADPNDPIPVDNLPPPDALNPIDAFFWEMEHGSGIHIYFDADEKALVQDYPELIPKLWSYIITYGQKPDGKNAFKLSSSDQTNYPKFANLLRNRIQSYVMNTPKILNALQNFSGLSARRIEVMLRWGFGPTVKVQQISDPTLWGNEGYIYGEFVKSTDPTSVKIDKKTVTYYENETSWPEVEKAWATLLAHVVIHEMSHLGANLTQTVDYTDGEASAGGGKYERRFDIAAFGYPASPGDVISQIVLKKPR